MSGRSKTLKSTDDDRSPQTASTFIPYLPDNVIEKILSFLPIKDASRSTVVSKQWSALWPCFTVIDLDEGDPINAKCFPKRRRFQWFLLHSLSRCSDQKLLDKWRIRAKCEPGYDETLVGRWVEFAVDRCVKELDIQLLCASSRYQIPHNVLTLQSLISLSLENVMLYACSDTVDGRVCLPSLKTMSLTEVLFTDDQADPAVWTIPSLISGCPRLEHLSIHRGLLGYNAHKLEISSDSLKSLEITYCHSRRVVVTAKSLESFTFYSDCSTCPYHGTLYLWECDSLKHLDISCKGLKHLWLHNCLETMESSICTPNLEYFEYGGYLKAKVHFVEPPSNLLHATISIMGASWSSEYYSSMIDFLESFDCSRQVDLRLKEAEGVIVPEHCRTEWSPPLPSIKQLQLYFSAPLGEREYCLRSSLIWMAPSAEILPFITYSDDEDDDDYDYYYNDNFAEEDNDNDVDNENVNIADD